MPGNPQVLGLLEEMLDSGKTPEEVCRDCPELLPEVRQRWQAFRRIDAHVVALLPGLRTPTDAGVIAPAPPTASLPLVPGYEVEAVRGRGGMGVVYQARHLALKRTVALKMLAAGQGDPAERARFRAEAEAVARLQHPNIVQVYEIGEAAGLPFIALEFVAGGSLAERLAGQPLPPRDAARLVAALAEAMHLAHSRNLVHRDLKPGNVLLAGAADTAVGQCQPKVTDFGLVRQLDADSGQTFDGMVMGTPSYMAPEQAEGRARSAGPAADVYALGAILYECLTGRPPFRGATPLETLEQVRTQEPVAPSVRNRQVPRDLETICLKCLRKEPERRYSSARELADDLGRFVRGEPVAARPVGAAERAVKWARRRPAVALLVALLLAFSGAAAGIGLWLHQQEADRQAARAQRERQARDAIERALTRVDDRRREERWGESLLILTEASTHLAEANSPLLKERLRQAQSDCRIAADLERVRGNSPLEIDPASYYRQRETDFREAFERAGLRIGDDAGPAAVSIRSSSIRNQLVAALDDWALAAFMLNNGTLVERLLRVTRLAGPEPRWHDRFRDPAIWLNQEQLLRLATGAFNTSPPPTGHQLALLGLLLRRTGARNQSTRLLAEACRRQPSDFWLNRELGYGLLLDGRPSEAAAYYRAALALRPDNASAHAGLGRALFEVGQMDDALAELRRAVALSPSSRSGRGYLMNHLALTGHWREAAAECGRALDAQPNDHRPPYFLGLTLAEHHRDEEAIVMFRKAVDTGTRATHVHSNLGLACMRTGRHEEAVTALRKASELSPSDPEAHRLLARALDTVGRPQEAIGALQRAIARVPDSAILCTDLGRLLRAQGRPKEAAAAYAKATKLDPGGGAAWDGLAAARLDQGRIAEARAATARLLELPAPEAERHGQRRQLALCDSLVAVEAELPAFLAGDRRPAKVSTQLALAEWCLKHRRLPAAAAGFYKTALSAEPSLTDDPEAGYRLHAACAAVLAGCGVGDAATLDEPRRAVLRRHALDWLTAEYNAWAERHRRGKRGDRTIAATAVRSWQQNKDLAGVRAEQALARFPREEQRAWQTLWANVTTLAARDPVALLDRARAHIGRREWQKAAACYAEAFELEPTDDGDLWYEYAAVQLLAGDRPGHRRTCAYMLVRCQAQQMSPYLAARACTLAPGSADHPKLPSRLAQEELRRNSTAFWSLTEQAALQVRAGRFRQAIPLLERSLVVDGRPGRGVLSWLWLAIAHRRLGKADEALRWLDKAAGWLDQQGGRMPLDTPYTGLHRHNWLEAHVLRQEAEALFR
jgi:serine/threonine-protein kinase